jgi:glycosyltransferase involved in cell wall biosynthesis
MAATRPLTPSMIERIPETQPLASHSATPGTAAQDSQRDSTPNSTHQAMHGSTHDTATRPLVSILLIAYNQAPVIADAVRAALAQTYQPLEILISDDASKDGTFAAIEATVAKYSGPHQVTARRNTSNEGITAHLSRLAGMARGELLFVTAGDDMSMPNRCERVVEFWLDHQRKPDLIATDLVDMDETGHVHERVSPTDLDTYRTFDDWLVRRPWLIGAAHTWSRRLFDRFGPMLPGAAAEDQIMTLRAILSGGALSLHEPLVRYRRGGISRKKVFNSVGEQVAHFRKGNRVGLVELAQLQRDAEIAGIGERMREALGPKLAREQFIQALFEADSFTQRVSLAARSRRAKRGLRMRMFLYASCPIVYAPGIYMKRLLRKRKATRRA